MTGTTRPVRIISKARAVRWAKTQNRLAIRLDISRQAVSLWGKYPPKDRQHQIADMMAAP